MTGPPPLADWAAAEAAGAADLARAAALFGALDERLRQAPEGWHRRLALTEAAELSWAAGDRIPADRLALWQALRLAGVQDDPLALARAGWALRRLEGGPDPAADLPAFLGRADDAGLGPRLAAAAPLHPLTRAAVALHTATPDTPVEAAVLAARLAAAEARGGARFQPLALGGGAALRAVGPPAQRLPAVLAGAAAASRGALAMLDRLADWQARAEAATATLTGRTPPRLIAALAAWPMLSAPMAEALTGASRAAAQRNLDRLAALGLIREVTGQGRFRFWTALLAGTGPRRPMVPPRDDPAA